MHHACMFKIINDLFEATRNASINPDVLILFKEAREYAQMHFNAEEYLMREVQYPGLLDQIQAHRSYIQMILSIEQEDRSNPKALSEDLLHFLKEWWLDHILKMDMNYVPFLKDK